MNEGHTKLTVTDKDYRINTLAKLAHKSPVSQHEFWESIYAAGEPAWDLGSATPVFQDLIAMGDIKPGKICLPGSGLGYDAVLFAQNGFDVTALEFSATAVRHQRELADAAKVEIDIIECDFFNLPERLFGNFDAVVEYVTLCAVDPVRRTDFARVMLNLLKPDGLYISLLFPIEDRLGGPPYGLNELETIETFESVGFTLGSAKSHFATIKPRRGREKLMVFKKPA